MPSLKYPANPPAIGEPETIAYRIGLYFLMIFISLGGLVVAVASCRRLVEAPVRPSSKGARVHSGAAEPQALNF